MREFVTNLFHDLRFAFRQIRKQPGFALIAVIILGLGIGGSAMAGSLDMASRIAGRASPKAVVQDDGPANCGLEIDFHIPLRP